MVNVLMDGTLITGMICAAILKERGDMTIKHTELLACNSFVDNEIGRVLDTIDQYAPDALVIYTSDHGEGLGEHCITNKGAAMYDEITKDS